MSDPFVEAYRPTCLDDVAGNRETVAALKSFIAADQFPLAIIFYGDYGTGKTASAQALVRDYYVSRGAYSADRSFKDIVSDPFLSPVVFIDSSVESDVDNIRERVRRFMQHMAWQGGRKFICFDEADRLGYHAQGALRPLIERYPSTVTIYTTNELDGIDGAIRSRASGGTFNFQSPTVLELEELLLSIAGRSGLDTSREDVGSLIHIVAENAKSPREAVGNLGTDILLYRSTGRLRSPETYRKQAEERKIFQEKGLEGLKAVQAGKASDRQRAAVKAWVKIYRDRGMFEKAKQYEEMLRGGKI